MKNGEFNERLWKKRGWVFFVFVCLTLFWLITITIPSWDNQGQDIKSEVRQVYKLGFFLPIFGIVFAISCFSKKSPIFKTTSSDYPAITLMGMLFVLFPIFALLHIFKEIEIKDSIWPFARISSLGLAILSGIIFFKQFRKNQIRLAGPVLMGLFAASLGWLFGMIVFKLFSLI